MTSDAHGELKEQEVGSYADLSRRQRHDSPVVPTFIPPLVAILAHLERDKGAPLAEGEVLAIRDKSVCMAMLREHSDLLAKQRGYDDVDPAKVWEDWQRIRATL